MSGTITQASSSLASELLLNKIMNGQLETSTGMSITAAGRALSSKLSSEAYETRVAEKNMVYGEGLVSAAQSELSNIRDQLTNMKKSLLDMQNSNGVSSTTLIKELGKEMEEGFAQISAAFAATYDGKALLNSADAIKLNAGNGMEISVLGDNIATAMKGDLRSNLANGAVKSTTTIKAAITAVDTAIDQILGYESQYSATIKALQNRQILLADEGASLDTAASAQGVAGLNGASNLLNVMLGNTEV